MKRSNLDGERLNIDVDLLDDWYNNEPAEFAPATLTAEEALEIYNAWMEARFDEDAGYRLDNQSYNTYVIFGEQYYYFGAEDEYLYWYNILIHMETGELLYLLIYDGMFGGSDIMALDDWYDIAYAP